MAKKTLILLLVLIAPFAQARAVLLCAMMNQAPVERCSCPGDRQHTPTDQRQTPHGCCTVVMEVGAREFVAPALQASDVLPVKQSWDDVPAIELASIVADADSTATALPGHTATVTRAAPPLPLYLATARLRL
jgi:hypothetical protein